MKRTSLYSSHVNLKAKMVDFSGFEMPINYAEGINKEVQAVRNSAGIFDVSHMGFFTIKGEGFIDKSNKLFASDIFKLKPGNAKYTVMCNEVGGIVDDLIVYMNEDSIDLIVNCSNLQKDYGWIKKNLDSSLILKDQSDSYSIIAIQGPHSRELLEKGLNTSIPLNFFNHMSMRYNDTNMIIARTGYTGELGYELVVENNVSLEVWRKLLDLGAQPCGLASRDVLRIEMCYSLYGNDINMETSPLEAGLSWLIDKSSNSFIGCESMKTDKKMVHFVIEERGIPRSEYGIIYNEKEVGHITSGTYSPTLNKGIGFGYLKENFDEIKLDANIVIDARGRALQASIVKPPFVKKTSLFD